MQFYQDDSGVRSPLPQMNIDTGMGLERLTAVMQDVHTVYETDLFRPILTRVAASSTGQPYGRDAARDFALRVLADHARGAMTFLAADGVVPGNEGRGYVLRRIVRRAVRYGRELGVTGSFLGRVVDVVDRKLWAAATRSCCPAATASERVITQEEYRFADDACIAASPAGTTGSPQAQERGEQRLTGGRCFGSTTPSASLRAVRRDPGRGRHWRRTRRTIGRRWRSNGRAAGPPRSFAHAAGARATRPSRTRRPRSFLGFDDGAPGTVLALRDGEGRSPELRPGRSRDRRPGSDGLLRRGRRSGRRPGRASERETGRFASRTRGPHRDRPSSHVGRG